MTKWTEFNLQTSEDLCLLSPYPVDHKQDGHSHVFSGPLPDSSHLGRPPAGCFGVLQDLGPDRSSKHSYGHSLQPITGSGTLTALSKNYLSIMMKTEAAATNECQLLQNKTAELTLGASRTLTPEL